MAPVKYLIIPTTIVMAESKSANIDFLKSSRLTFCFNDVFLLNIFLIASDYYFQKYLSYYLQP